MSDEHKHDEAQLSIVPRPAPFDELLPGLGETVVGQTELNEFIGENRPKVATVQVPTEGWTLRLKQHVIFFVQDVIVPAQPLERSAFDDECARRYKACHLCLATWPRGSGVGELLTEPVIDDTLPRHRGVHAEWWLAVASRAAFVPTRIFVEAFVKPTTKADQCALWFFIPEEYRARPEPPRGVFVSHAWDLSMWDIRPESNSVIWLDVLAIVQHPIASVGGAELPAEEAYAEIRDLVPTVEAISNTLLILGGGGGVSAPPLLPLARSWCCYEIAHTPKGKLRVRVGWSTWQLDVQRQIRKDIDAMDMAKAEALDQDDKKMIDALVVDKLGCFEEANRAIRDSVLRGYFAAVSSAFQVAPTEANSADSVAQLGQIEGRIKRVSLSGQRPLLDKRVLELFAGGWMDTKEQAQFNQLGQAASLAEWAQEQLHAHAELAPTPEPESNPSSESLARWLKGFRMEQYHSALLAEGVDEPEDLLELNQFEISDLVAEIGMKKIVTKTFMRELDVLRKMTQRGAPPNGGNV